MTETIIIALCSLFLLAYIFDITASKTKIPSVILLLFLGWVVQQFSTMFAIKIPNLQVLLPVLGTVGLILIVLEGSLDLELNKSKIPIIKKSVIAALIPLVGMSMFIAFIFYRFGDFSFKDSLVNAIPLSIISSAVAIPSVKYASKRDKEFVVYESSLSDIFGVIFFNFIALNTIINFTAFVEFGVQFVIMIIISFVATFILALILSRINHHIKFAPIIILIILIYELSKYFHLPALIFILLFGLFLSNIEKINDIKWITIPKPVEFHRDVDKFKEIVIEGTFLIRSLFFLLFGFLITTTEILNIESVMWSSIVIAMIYVFRAIQLKLIKLPMRPLLLIAPRGLITILLFISIEPTQTIEMLNRSLIIQVIIVTALVMMIGLMTHKDKEKKVQSQLL